MERKIEINLKVTFSLTRRKAVAALAALLVLAQCRSLGSETMTMVTYYPAPAGMYQRLTTTGATALARDSEGLAVGAAASGSYDSVQAKLDVNGYAAANDVWLKDTKTWASKLPENAQFVADECVTRSGSAASRNSAYWWYYWYYHPYTSSSQATAQCEPDEFATAITSSESSTTYGGYGRWWWWWRYGGMETTSTSESLICCKIKLRIAKPEEGK